MLFDSVKYSKELIVFGLVGLLNTFGYFVLFIILTLLIEVPPIYSGVISYLIAVLISYKLHASLTFKGKRSERTPARFVVTNIIMLVLISLVNQSAGLEEHPVMAALIVCILIPLVSYILLKFWAFS
ncbi:GtrA family protein [Spartinivicinus poritis]|uniref:GtrA family protein n=1 Tax=Spartinivicinus poritis TaxID=2994640 RepID=A0ABT5U9X1_9GAMM|nr:GtrA family protein [Spartinivicinus sp. A2-2]MDE1462268.1 GtrA family protein [Spartinivicinus sp. A2-2]